MKYCTYCGSQVEDGALFCPNCGARLESKQSSYGSAETEVPPVNFDFSTRRAGTGFADDGQRSKGITVLCFFFWWLGLILWFVWRDTKPGHAISAAKGALMNVCVGAPVVGLVLWIIWKKERPEFAKACGIAAIIGAVIWAVLFVVEVALAAAEGLGSNVDPFGSALFTLRSLLR